MPSGKKPKPIVPLTESQREEVEKWRYLVQYVLRRVWRSNASVQYRLTPDDLISTGFLALCNAIQRYQPHLGATFMTYAYVSIRREMLREIRLARLVRVPDHVLCDVNAKRESRYGNEAERAMACIAGSVAATATAGLVDRRSPCGKTWDWEEVSDLIRTLPEREQHILAAKFGLAGGNPETYDQISIREGITRQRCQQIVAWCVTKIRYRLGLGPHPRRPYRTKRAKVS